MCPTLSTVWQVQVVLAQLSRLRHVEDWSAPLTLEGVDYPDTGGLEVADVAGDYGEAMFKG